MALPTVNSSRYTMTVPSTGQELEFRPFLVKEEKIKKVSAYTMNSSPTSFSFMAESQSTFLLNIFKGIKVKERCQVPVAVTLIR